MTEVVDVEKQKMLGILLCIQVSLMLPWIDGFITASENEPGLSYLLFNERR
jgi:hypothetical protein